MDALINVTFLVAMCLEIGNLFDTKFDSLSRLCCFINKVMLTLQLINLAILMFKYYNMAQLNVKSFFIFYFYITRYTLTIQRTKGNLVTIFSMYWNELISISVLSPYSHSKRQVSLVNKIISFNERPLKLIISSNLVLKLLITYKSFETQAFKIFNFINFILRYLVLNFVYVYLFTL